MVNKKGHRRFGNVRKLSSGRWQARYRGPDGLTRSAPETFGSKRDAEQWLTVIESEVLRGDWSDPLAGRVPLSEYGKKWIEEHKLGQRTREEYDSLWQRHIDPYLGRIELAEISTDTIRSWRATLLREGRSEDRTAKAYRLLRIKSAGDHRAAERSTATVAQVYALAERMPDRFRVLVLAAAFTGLRWGELIALRRCDVDLTGGVLHVRRRLAQPSRGGLQEGPPKSTAGARSLALPEILAEELRKHIDQYAGPGPEGLLFRGPKGAPLRRSNFGRSTKWKDMVMAAGLPRGFHFHDLRHTGNQLAAASGATTRELMHRMGHGSMRAALIYQHATSARDRRIATALSDLVATERQTTSKPDTTNEDRRTARPGRWSRWLNGTLMAQPETAASLVIAGDRRFGC